MRSELHSSFMVQNKLLCLFGRPAKPVRLMVSLMLMKQMYDLGDETTISNYMKEQRLEKEYKVLNKETQVTFC